MLHDVLIVGASVRAAAFSAVQCGLRPRCADYFADRDLAAIAPVDRIDPRDAARQFVALAESLPPTPWVYTGGLENNPEVVDRIAGRHRLWGTSGQTLRQVRDPFLVAAALDRAGIACPQVRRDAGGLPRDGTWLAKPIRSGGGRGIVPLGTGDPSSKSASFYYQERLDGPSFSALFIGTAGGARLIGVTKQLIGVPGFHFGYRGSIGPWHTDEALTARFCAIGDALASSFGLVGWFGVDAIVRDGVPWPVEVNPRYTASVEVHERARGRSLFSDHVRASEPDQAACGECPADERPGRRFVAKLIVHAPRYVLVTAGAFDNIVPGDDASSQTVADVPWPGTSFETGDPVLTLITSGESLALCRSRAVRLERKIMNRLRIAPQEWTATET